MSYSYIKSVFPNFKTNNVSQKSIYNSLNIDSVKNETAPLSAQKPPSAYNEEEIHEFVKKLLEKEHNELKKIPIEKDNLRFYTPEAPKQFMYDNSNANNYILSNASQNTNLVEHFDNTTECDFFTKHVLECNKCKGILMKQWNLEKDKRKNQEIMELLSYIMFGIFILLIIDNLQKTN